MTSLQAKRRAARDINRKLGRDWHYAAPGFEKGLAHLRSAPEVFRQGEKIWEHGSNEVFRLALPPSCGDFDIVYKHNVGKKCWNHCVSASAAVREAVNMLAMSRLGFPMIELLAVGESRSWRYWTDAFLVTRFAEGYSDGRHVLPGFEYGEDSAVRDAFVGSALGQLSKMHALRICHKGFKVYNILWKRTENGVDLRFLDVASCRMMLTAPYMRHMLRDLGNFLMPFKFPREELQRWLAVYLEGKPPIRLSVDGLLRQLEPWIARSGFNWGQVHRNA